MWIAGAHVVVGLLQAGVVAFGIRAMLRANAERDVAVADATAAARREADQRHAETMAALKAQSASLEAVAATLAEATAALKIVVERAAPPANR